tara:strand:+ start:4192 stop:5295 length:1104 start_codon:yes stop_codon:yes gene_type:complete
MDHYLETIGLFYDEKVKFLSNKDNFIKCNGCPEMKEFKETSKELKLTCGESGKGECGVQITIKFPKYINYENEISILKDKMNEGLNWKSINNYIDVKDKLKNKNEKNKKYKEEIDKIVETFNKVNLEHKKEKLQKFYDNRISYIKECKDLQYKLKRGDGDEITKKGYTEEYVKKVLLMNSEYGEINNLIKELDNFYMDEKPIVKIINTHHMNDKKRSKKLKPQPIPEGERVRWEKDDEFIYGVVLKDKGKRVMIKPDSGGRVLIEKKIIEKVEEDEPEPEPDNEVEEEEVEEEEVEEEVDEEKEGVDEEKVKGPESVKEGDNVKWTLKGKDFEGVVLKVDKRMKVNVNVMNTDGDKVKVKKSILIIQ